MARDVQALIDYGVRKFEALHERSSVKDETSFLPAALEIVETPPSPLGRTILWFIIIVVVLALVWSCLSKVDEVAVAEGQLMPRGHLRSVEASEQGVIKAINVHEGQHVHSGDVLIELDANQADADAKAAQVELATAALTKAGDNAILNYGANGRTNFNAPAGSDAAAAQAEHELVKTRVEEYNAKRESLEEKRQAAVATVAATQAEIDKLKDTLPLLKEQWDEQKTLAADGFGSRQKYLQTQQAYIGAQHDLESQTASLSEARAQVSSLTADMAQAKGDLLSQAAQEGAEAQSGVSERQQSVRKVNDKKDHMTLVAPVSGVVQEVTVTTIGQTPEIGKPLVTLVADGEELVVEGLLLNKDAGFVRAGQKVSVKLEAYPFTRYGVLHGVVESVSPDATVDQHKGLVYPIRIKLLDHSLMVDNRPAVLTAGMAATLEITIGHRSVIDYLWSPVAKTVSEAGKEK